MRYGNAAKFANRVAFFQQVDESVPQCLTGHQESNCDKRKIPMKRRFCFSIVVLSLALTALDALDCSSAEPRKPVFPAPPRLVTTVRELAEEKRQPGFTGKRDAAIKRADALINKPVRLPEGHGSWIFYYACPDDGSTLKMLSLNEHQCPKCQRKYSDERTVAAYRCQMHHDLEHASVALGWAYAWSAEDRYAKEVRRILVHLADAYSDYPLRLDRWGRRGPFAPLGGRRYVQSLDEAVGVIRLAKAYDLTRTSSVWSKADREHVERDFFRATATSLLVFNQDINNHQTWYNAGLMAIASTLGDAELVNHVLSMRGGFHDQLQRSLGDDGLWYEGAMAYQNYALQAMVEIVDVGRRLGLELHKEPRFKKLIASSLKVAYPDGRYPAINDSDPGHFRSFNWSYEWAWKTYRDPVFAHAAAWGRPKRIAELLGPDAKPQWPVETRSINLPDAGLAILRMGASAEQSCVFFDYGQHGGGHGHYDKLNITLFANGREWLLDTGRIGYSHKEYKTWVKHTVAQNTVVVDGKSQAPAMGKLYWLKSGDGWAACAGECDSAYRDVTLRRYLLLTSRMLVDVFEVDAARDIDADWVAHAVTEPVRSVDSLESSTAEPLGTSSGYPHLVDVRKWNAKQKSRWDFAASQQRLRLWLADDDTDEIYTAIGIGNWTNQKAPCLVRRRKGVRKARFVTVYDLSGKGDHIVKVKAAVRQPATVDVQTTDRNWTVRFAAKDLSVVVKPAESALR